MISPEGTVQSAGSFAKVLVFLAISIWLSSCNSPNFSRITYNFVLSSDASGVIGSVQASDPDANTTLHYSIISATAKDGVFAEIFDIDSSNGDISIKQGHSLNVSQSPYTLAVEVSDGNLKAISAVTVSIISNQAPPILAKFLHLYC